MSRGSWQSDNRALRGFYRDKENGWIFGVCAGVAGFFNFRTCTVRLIAVISLLFAFWFTVLIYFAATLLFRERPLIYAGDSRESDFWRTRHSDGNWSHS